jgi:hypothetical protein
MSISDTPQEAGHKAMRQRIDHLNAEIERLRDVVRRCEWWLSTHPEGEAMRDVCRAALTPSE